MNVQKPSKQLSLFSYELPDWKSLPREAQQSILEALAQMLLQSLQQPSCNQITTSTTSTPTESDDVT